MSQVRGIRGAITVRKNDADEIVSSTMTLLRKMVGLNRIKIRDIASVIFSVTKDLNAEFPAIAARKMGWRMTPLLCTYEVNVRGSLKRCIRVLMHVNSGKKQSAIKHVYLNDAKQLRSDLG
jgi:chorismate mutase